MIAYHQSSRVINLLNVVLQRRSDVVQVEIGGVNKAFRRKHMNRLGISCVVEVFVNNTTLEMLTCLTYLSILCFNFGAIFSCVW